MIARLSYFAVPIIVFVGTFAMSSPASLQDPSVDHAAKVQELLQQRLQVLLDRSELIERQFQQATGTYNEVLDARDDVFAAELELALSQERRQEVLKSRVENFVQGEKLLEEQKQLARASGKDLLAATSRRLQAEIDLERYLASLESAPEPGQ